MADYIAWLTSRFADLVGWLTSLLGGLCRCSFTLLYPAVRLDSDSVAAVSPSSIACVAPNWAARSGLGGVGSNVTLGLWHGTAQVMPGGKGVGVRGDMLRNLISEFCWLLLKVAETAQK